MTVAIELGAVKPHVRAACDEIASKFGVTTVYGVGSRPTKTSDHPKGLALDFMVPVDSSKGDDISTYIIANWKRLGVRYIIWRQRILSAPTGSWRKMGDRGSITTNHRDHVHVSFNASGGGGGTVVDTVKTAVGDAIGTVSATATNQVGNVADGIGGQVSGIVNAVGTMVGNYLAFTWGVALFVAGILLLAAPLIGSVASTAATVRSGNLTAIANKVG